MSSPQLWTPQSQPSTNTTRKSDSNSVPGTWLQLAPSFSPTLAVNNVPEVSAAEPLPSPAMKPVSSFQDELAIHSSKFLSNHSSRTSSFSSTTTQSGEFKHASLGKRSVNLNPSIERREVSVGRVGGLGAAFYANH